MAVDSNESRRKKFENIKNRLSDMGHEELMETIDKVFKLIEAQDQNPKTDGVSYFLELRDNIEIYELMLFELSGRMNQSIIDYEEVR